MIGPTGTLFRFVLAHQRWSPLVAVTRDYLLAGMTTKEHVKAVPDRVPTWSRERQQALAETVLDIESMMQGRMNCGRRSATEGREPRRGRAMLRTFRRK